jgi:hypothetical protein
VEGSSITVLLDTQLLTKPSTKLEFQVDDFGENGPPPSNTSYSHRRESSSTAVISV